MASGAGFTEDNSSRERRWSKICLAAAPGHIPAILAFNTRVALKASAFTTRSIETQVLTVVLRRATGRRLPIPGDKGVATHGREADATWITAPDDSSGAPRSSVRRCATGPAGDASGERWGARWPADHSKDYLLEATVLAPASRGVCAQGIAPGQGYGYHCWTMRVEKRRFPDARGFMARRCTSILNSSWCCSYCRGKTASIGIERWGRARGLCSAGEYVRTLVGVLLETSG